MGSGKRKYKNRPKKFSLGPFKEEDKIKVNADKEDVKRLLDIWEKNKKEDENNP